MVDCWCDRRRYWRGASWLQPRRSDWLDRRGPCRRGARHMAGAPARPASATDTLVRRYQYGGVVGDRRRGDPRIFTQPDTTRTSSLLWKAVKPLAGHASPDTT